MKFGKQNNGFALLSFDKAQDKRGFTLLELLIVIAIIAVLSAILIFVLNPAETLRKGRDSERISDLATINRALAFYITTSFNPDLDGDGTRGVCGTNVFAARNNASAITDTEIAEKTLKTTAPTGDSNSPANDGSGWIPINLASLTGGSPISRFPLDPSYRVANVGAVTDDDLLYLYGCDTDTTYELNANLESSQFKSGGSDDRESTDGGNNSNVLEVGTKLTILGTSGSGGGGGETTITVKVASPNDDARKDDIGFDLNHQRYSAGEGPTNSGARFVSVGIPDGATVVEAHLKLTARFAWEDTFSSRIRGEYTGNANAFSTEADYNSRLSSLTSASFVWVPPAWVQNTEYESPNISSVIQEIIGHPSWNQNNAMTIFWLDNGSTDYAAREGYSYDGDPLKAPGLEITYTIP